MEYEAAKCPRCGKTLTAEQIEAGASLICPRCAEDVKPKGRDADSPQRRVESPERGSESRARD